MTAAPMSNRSAEELAMRDAIEAWGRARWPEARVVHELVVSQCRIDMAFIAPAHLIGIEIKSSRDVMDRVKRQLEAFTHHLPEVWFAMAPKWDKVSVYPAGRLTVTEPGGVIPCPYGSPRIDPCCTVPMLALLWRAELVTIAARHDLPHSKRSRIRDLSAAIARGLTGDEIVTEVCRELRGRSAFWKSDDPIRVTAPRLTRSDLLQGAPA